VGEEARGDDGVRGRRREEGPEAPGREPAERPPEGEAAAEGGADQKEIGRSQRPAARPGVPESRDEESE